jgi:hypothetical protein
LSKLCHFFYAIHINLSRAFGNVRFAAGRHTGTCGGGGKLICHCGVNLVWLPAAEFIRGDQNLVGFTLVPLLPVMTVIYNAVDMLVHENK